MPEDIKTPSTVKELGIELQGFKELVSLKFDTMSENISRLTTALETANQNKADKVDLEALIARVVVLETKRPWSAIILSGTFSAVITATVLYVVNDIIRGGK